MKKQIKTSKEKIPISIITVCFNAESLIESTLKSITSQEAKFEYLVIDGDSSDETMRIIEKYKLKIDIIVSEPDKGIYDAMNKGLIMASGEYILFLNAGDELAHSRIISEIFDEPKADIYYGETILINQNREVLGTRSSLTTRPLPARLTKKSFLNGQPVSHQSFLVRRDIVENFDLRFKCSADIEWMIKAVMKATKIRNINQPISKYLLGGESDRKLKRCWIERFQILLKYFDFVSVVMVHFSFAIRYLRFGAYKHQPNDPDSSNA